METVGILFPDNEQNDKVKTGHTGCQAHDGNDGIKFLSENAAD